MTALAAEGGDGQSPDHHEAKYVIVSLESCPPGAPGSASRFLYSLFEILQLCKKNKK